MQKEIVISVKNVSKRFLLPHEKKNSLKSVFTSLLGSKTTYSNQLALNDISFDIEKGEFFGIVGRNGSGKSTLLKIIAGIYQPTKGSVSVEGKLVPFIELGVGFNPDLTGRENVFLNGAILGFNRKQIQANYKKIVDFAELEEFMDQKLKNYSSGMQVRLAFACATMAKAEVLLIDEVLAVGDADFQRKCYNYFKQLKKAKTTVVFVSHDMSAVQEFCDRAVLIENNKVLNIGNTTKIANRYRQLFLEESSTVNDKAAIDDGEINRWGTGEIKIKTVEAKIIDNFLNVNVRLKASKDADGVVYGLHVLAADGNEVTAMNNRMINQPDIKNIKSGNTIDISWKMQNIFADGKYTINITIVNANGAAYDWYEKAAAFQVKRIEKSTTSVLPPISTKYKITTT